MVASVSVECLEHIVQLASLSGWNDNANIPANPLASSMRVCCVLTGMIRCYSVYACYLPSAKKNFKFNNRQQSSKNLLSKNRFYGHCINSSGPSHQQ